MNEFYIAGIILFGLFLVLGFVVVNSNANTKAQANKIGENIGSLAEIASRADISLWTAVFSFFGFGTAWFFGNIVWGNVSAVDAILAWVNSINGEMTLIVPILIVLGFSMLPSLGQFYRIHFKLAADNRDLKWCLRVQAADWLLNTIGFYSYAMPLGIPPGDSPTNWINGLIVFVISGIVAFIVGVWCENMLHSAITRLQWLLLTPLHLRGDYVDVIQTKQWAKQNKKKTTKEKSK